MATYQTATTSHIEVNGISYAYRKLGKLQSHGVPLLMLHHFRAPMDFWDPLLINLFAQRRQVILFDNAGVGKSTGDIPDSILSMANHAYIFLDALKVSRIDVYGFSMGGMIAQQLALDHPEIIRKLVLTGTGPGKGPDGQPDILNFNAARALEIATKETSSFEDMYKLFFFPSDTSKAAAEKWWKRVQERSPQTSGEERSDMVQGTGMRSQGTALTKWSGGEGLISQRFLRYKCNILTLALRRSIPSVE